MRFFAGVVFAGPLVSALAFAGPKATSVIDDIKLDPQGWSPRPTAAPEFKELAKRQATGVSTLIEAPDLLCGYQFGVSSSGLGLCGTASKCGFATILSGYGSVYCFSSITTQARSWTSCINGGTAASSCLSNASCNSNSLIALCTGTQSLCNLGSFIGLGVEAVWCDSTSYSDTVPIPTTYAGQVGRSFSIVGSVAPSTISRLTVSSSSTSSSTSSPTTSTSSTSSRSTSSPTSTQSSTSSVGTSSSLSESTTVSPTTFPTISPAPPTPQSKSSTPIGAIVGGAIGGIALIAAIAMGIFFLLRQRKRKDKPTTPEISGPPTSQINNAGNNPHPQYLSEKYAATTQAAYIAPVPTSAKPGEQLQYPQQQPQPQYQQVPPVAQPYQSYQPVPQQHPSGPHAEQYYPQDVQTQSQHLPIQPQPNSHELSDSNRGSMMSGVSAPGSPAPPYTGTIPTVPEVPGQSTHHARPFPNRYEMPGAH